MRNIQLLDCTLRDGGYINNWNWGYENAKDIVDILVKADVEVIEVGFLRNVNKYDPDIAISSDIDQLNTLLPENTRNTIFSAMAMQSNYEIEKLKPYQGKGIEMIRITAHDYDMESGILVAKEVKEKGYKLSINPINIMGYSDERVLWILEQVNKIHPYQFSIVDTFGSMKRRDLDRLVSLADNNLERDIRLSLHLHENMSLSCGLAQRFIDKHLNRPIALDGSLMGMGRTPGNLPLELIADYLNDYADKSYDIEYMLDAIQDYISEMKGGTKWGYTPAYFLSARFNLHRNYAEYYLEKGDLTNRDINHILERFDRSKATCFDNIYADQKYQEYKNQLINDMEDIKKLKEEFLDKEILILAPGKSLAEHNYEIKKFIDRYHPIVISVNFASKIYDVDYAFFSNNRRISKYNDFACKLIVTSNLMHVKADYRINYGRLSSAFEYGYNSVIMLLKLLKDISADRKITIAGADGYEVGAPNYSKEMIGIVPNPGEEYNVLISKAVKKLNLSIRYLTPTKYKVDDAERK